MKWWHPYLAAVIGFFVLNVFVGVIPVFSVVGAVLVFFVTATMVPQEEFDAAIRPQDQESDPVVETDADEPVIETINLNDLNRSPRHVDSERI